MSFPACLPEIAASWPWTFSWQGRCHSFLQNYHNCKTWVIKSWFFFSTRNKMNLLYSTLKKVPILITDQGHWGEQSRWWRWSTESGTQYPIHGPGPTGKNKGTGNSKLDKWTKIYGQKCHRLWYNWIRNYRYLLLRAQGAPYSGSVKMVCKVRKNYWKLCHLIYTRTY